MNKTNYKISITAGLVGLVSGASSLIFNEKIRDLQSRLTSIEPEYLNRFQRLISDYQSLDNFAIGLTYGTILVSGIFFLNSYFSERVNDE